MVVPRSCGSISGVPRRRVSISFMSPEGLSTADPVWLLMLVGLKGWKMDNFMKKMYQSRQYMAWQVESRPYGRFSKKLLVCHWLCLSQSNNKYPGVCCDRINLNAQWMETFTNDALAGFECCLLAFVSAFETAFDVLGPQNPGISFIWRPGWQWVKSVACHSAYKINSWV